MNDWPTGSSATGLSGSHADVIVTELGGVLFSLSRPKGLRVGPIVEKCAEFRNPFHKKISTELFSEIEIKQGYRI